MLELKDMILRSDNIHEMILVLVKMHHAAVILGHVRLDIWFLLQINHVKPERPFLVVVLGVIVSIP